MHTRSLIFFFLLDHHSQTFKQNKLEANLQLQSWKCISTKGGRRRSKHNLVAKENHVGVGGKAGEITSDARHALGFPGHQQAVSVNSESSGEYRLHPKLDVVSMHCWVSGGSHVTTSCSAKNGERNCAFAEVVLEWVSDIQTSLLYNWLNVDPDLSRQTFALNRLYLLHSRI